MLRQKNPDRYSAQQLSHIAWAFGALSLRHSEFFTTLASHINMNLSTFKAQGLSNIAWAFAMVAFRENALLLRMAPEIVRGVSELRSLALARCAWAYRVLAVQVPDLWATIATEAARKVSEFPIKALTKLMDAVYLAPEAKDSIIVEAELDLRTADIVTFITQQIGTPGEDIKRLEEMEYRQGMLEFGIMDAGLVGTPMLLKHLKIDMPSYDFIEKCKQQQQQVDKAEGSPPHEFSAADIDLTWSWLDVGEDDIGSTTTECKWQDFLMQHGAVQCRGSFQSQGQVHQSVVDGNTGAVLEETYVPVSLQGPRADREDLIAVELGGRFGKYEPAFIVLSDIHAQLHHCGAKRPGVSVTGLLQIFSSQVPSISTIGALHQFKVLYPSIEIEFLEQAGVIED